MLPRKHKKGEPEAPQHKSDRGDIYYVRLGG